MSGYAQWNQFTTYVVSDVVEYAGFVYVANAVNVNVVPNPPNPTWTNIGSGGGGGAGVYLPLVGGTMAPTPQGVINSHTITNLTNITGSASAGFDTVIQTVAGTGNDISIDADTGVVNVDAFDVLLNAATKVEINGGSTQIVVDGTGAGSIEMDLNANVKPYVVGYDASTKELTYFTTPSGGGGMITSVGGGNNIIVDNVTNPAIPTVALLAPLTANLDVGVVDITTSVLNADIDFTTNGTGAVHVTKDTAGTAVRVSNTVQGTATVVTNTPAQIELYKNRGATIAPVAGDTISQISAFGRDTAFTKQEYSRITTTIRDPTAGATRDGSMEIGVITNGAFANYIQLNGNDVPSGELNILKPIDLGSGSSGTIKTSVTNQNIVITANGIGRAELSSGASGNAEVNGANAVNIAGGNGINLRTGTVTDRMKILPTVVELAGVPFDTKGQIIKSTSGSLVVGGTTVFDTQIVSDTTVSMKAGSSASGDRFMDCTGAAGVVNFYRKLYLYPSTGPVSGMEISVESSPIQSLRFTNMPIAPNSGICDGVGTGTVGQVITANGGGGWSWQTPASPPPDSLSAVLSAGNSAGLSQINMDGNSIITSSGDFTIDASSSSGAGNISAILKSGANLIFQNLPTTSPGVSGAVWNNGGVLNIA